MSPNELIGRKLIAVNYMTSFEGLDNYSNDSNADFDYLPLGGFHIKLSNGSSYCIADYNTTTLGTDGVGIRQIQNGQTDLTKEEVPADIRRKWENKIGQSIVALSFYLQKEQWTNNIKNEIYSESLQIDFENGETIYYFCGDVEDFNILKGQYDLLGGRDSGVLFFDKMTFAKYGLDRALKVEKYTGYNTI